MYLYCIHNYIFFSSSNRAKTSINTTGVSATSLGQVLWLLNSSILQFVSLLWSIFRHMPPSFFSSCSGFELLSSHVNPSVLLRSSIRRMGGRPLDLWPKYGLYFKIVLHNFSSNIWWHVQQSSVWVQQQFRYTFNFRNSSYVNTLLSVSQRYAEHLSLHSTLCYIQLVHRMLCEITIINI